MLCIRPILAYQSKSTWFNVIILKMCQCLLVQFVVEAGQRVMALVAQGLRDAVACVLQPRGGGGGGTLRPRSASGGGGRESRGGRGGVMTQTDADEICSARFYGEFNLAWVKTLEVALDVWGSVQTTARVFPLCWRETNIYLRNISDWRGAYRCDRLLVKLQEMRFCYLRWMKCLSVRPTVCFKEHGCIIRTGYRTGKMVGKKPIFPSGHLRYCRGKKIPRAQNANFPRRNAF